MFIRDFTTEDSHWRDMKISQCFLPTSPSASLCSVISCSLQLRVSEWPARQPELPGLKTDTHYLIKFHEKNLSIYR